MSVSELLVLVDIWCFRISIFINAQHQDQLLLGPCLPSLGRGGSGHCDKVKLTGARF